LNTQVTLKLNPFRLVLTVVGAAIGVGALALPLIVVANCMVAFDWEILPGVSFSIVVIFPIMLVVLITTWYTATADSTSRQIKS